MGLSRCIVRGHRDGCKEHRASILLGSCIFKQSRVRYHGASSVIYSRHVAGLVLRGGRQLPAEYLGLLILAGLALLFAAVVLAVSARLGPRRRGMSLPYESGVAEPLAAPGRTRLPVHYYRVALLFLIFDVEAVFVYPWAVAYRQLGSFALGEMLIFLGILLFGYWYARRRGGFEWE